MTPARASVAEPPLGHSLPAETGIVHDLGHFIQVATSALNILARDDAVRAGSLRPIIDGAMISLEQAGALVRQRLGRARPDPARPAAANVGACLAEAEALLRISEPRIILAMLVCPDLPPAACDPVDLRSAILNLLFNACDAMAGAGQVSLEASTIPASDATMVELRVADSGVGMSPRTIQRAFDPFFTTKSGGLGGIGLPMVERFVSHAGGRIFIESEAGAGTTVTLHLPAAPRTVGN